MTWVNNYRPPATSTVNVDKLLDPSIPWDVNFVYPVKILQNDRVKLYPFVPALFSKDLLELFRPNPELFTHLPRTPWKDLHELLDYIQLKGQEKTGNVFFAILGLSQGTRQEPWGEGKLAGIIMLLGTDPTNLCTEIGIMIGKQFQRTHVTSNAVGLLLQWCFGDLGQRRVQWMADSRNEPSIITAKKMGFRYEGLLRWQMVIPKEKSEIQGAAERVERNGQEEAPGHHSAMLAIGWDDWEGGVREELAVRMARRV